MRSDKWISEPLRHVEAVSRPAFELPPLSCDAHMHVFGPSEIYRSIPNPKYTKPEGSLSEYLALADRLNIGRIVFVQASFYGTDNSCILDAMAQVGSRCRGVAFLPEAPPAALIDDLHGRGVRGLRLDLFRADAERFDRNRILEMIARGRRVAKQAGWHLEF
jgi:predicted TIM-barrel fold metal-dependent hydrolase